MSDRPTVLIKLVENSGDFDAGVFAIMPDADATGTNERTGEMAVVHNSLRTMVPVDENGIARLKILWTDIERAAFADK